MEISQEQRLLDNTLTFVQVLNVSDVAEAAAIMAAQLSQNPDQIMQIVAIPTSSAKTGATVTSAQPTIPAEATTAPTEKASSTAADTNGKAGIVGGSEERLCLICGDRANGVHYNVLSCEGCKSFFLRSNRSGATFTCAQGGNCNMDLYTRRHCPACRMKRCLECGMKVERVWNKNRLQTRKPLIRRKRKKKQPHAPAETQPPSSAPAIPNAAAPSTSLVTAPHPIPSGAGTSVSTSPSSTRSNSPTLLLPTTFAASTVTPMAFPVTNPNLGTATVQLSASADIPMVMDDLSETSTSFMNLTTPGTSSQNLFSQAPLPLLTPAQEQLMQILEKGYNASTEVLKHLSKDVPLFRKTYWSKLKGIDGSANDSQDDGEESELEGSEPKRCKAAIDADPLTNPNSGEQPVEAANTDMAAIPCSDPLAVLSAATGQNIDVIYKLTSFATGGQISDPTSAINVLGASEQGMRVIQTIGSMVQGQNLNTLVSLSKLVGQIIGMGGGLLNDNLADTILGSLTGTLFNGSPGSMEAAINAQLLQSIPTTSSTQDQNGNESTQASAQEDLRNNAAVAKLVSSGLAEALALLAAMASSSQNKETIVEMVKRAAVSLLKWKDEPFMMSLSSPQRASPSSSNFYMPTDVGENEVKTSPFLQSLQRVTSFLTSGKMSSSSNSSTKAKRIVNKEMLHIAMDMFAVLVKQTIHFAKSIPGFTKLSCDDQAVLIKSSIVDALLLRCADSYALDKDCLVNNTNGDKFDVNMMYQLGFSTLPEVVFEFMRDTKACGLTTAEYALFTAAALLSPDRSDLKDRKLVEEMQLEMILALQAATKVFHADKPFLFTKLITKLTTLRDMSILHLSEIMAVKVQEQDLSPLIVELFGLDS